MSSTKSTIQNRQWTKTVKDHLPTLCFKNRNLTIEAYFQNQILLYWNKIFHHILRRIRHGMNLALLIWGFEESKRKTDFMVEKIWRMCTFPHHWPANARWNHQQQPLEMEYVWFSFRWTTLIDFSPKYPYTSGSLNLITCKSCWRL